MDRRIWLPTVCFLVLLSSPALGQKRNRTAADALFREGREASDKGDYARACPKFAESLALDPASGTLLNLAVCEEHLGKLVTSRQHIAQLIPQLPANDDRLSFAKDFLSKLDARIARLSLILGPGAPAGTEVKDGHEGPALPFGTEIPLDPGEHTLSINTPGRPPTELRVKLGEGQRDTRTIAPPPPEPEKKPAATAPAPPPPAAEPPKSASKLRLVSYISGGVGVAGLGVAAITGAMLLGKKSGVDALCPNKVCSQEGLRLKQEAEKTALLPVNTAAWIVGLTGVAAGVGLFVMTRDKSTNAPQTTAFATVLPGGGGLGVRSQF
jgi:hypothetical protein